MSDIGIKLIYWDRVLEAGFWILLTLFFYYLALRIQRALGGTPLANPVLLASAPIIALLVAADIWVGDYMGGGQALIWLLGPATVGLAVPLYRNFARVRSALVPMAVSLAVGSAVAVLSAVLIGDAMGASLETVRSLAPKSVTTPIAMGIAEEIGGYASLTAAFVIITGIIGAVFGSMFFNLCRIGDARARGFAMGIAAHGIGTARAFQEDEVSGTFSGVAMALNGIVTALVLPLLWLAFAG
ncbi:MAG: membrane protein [Parvibaculum sp.]|jgi:predicted murein hydrolase (TIGR00659 family)|uniref:LrgB family protein n=1 Tax=Parvibaculum sp. TaxID=2024848 RepID=UPI0035BAAF69